MTDTFATSARPRGCAIAWATKDSLYAEIPCRDNGPPFIIRERKTAEGLARILNVLVEHDDRQPNLTPATHHKVTKVPKGATSRASWATDDQREATRNILARMGITQRKEQ